MTASISTDAIVLTNLAGATDLGTIATANIIHVDGDYANVAAMVDVLEDSGAYELTFNGIMATTDLFLVLWDDGTDSYLSAVGTGAQIADNATAAAGDLSGFDIITFTGVADADDISAAMVGTTFIA